MLRRVCICILSATFGLILIAAGKEVYDIGSEKLVGATQELCGIVQKEQSPCNYECGQWSLFSKENSTCRGYSYIYTSVAPDKCGKKTMPFDERRVSKDNNTRELLCRCSPDSPQGDCWVTTTQFLVNHTYPCTVKDNCRSFDFVVPSDLHKAGVVNIFIGVVFLTFSWCPETFLDYLARAITACATCCASDVLLPLLLLCFRGGKGWLRYLFSYTTAPARDYLSEEEEPLL